MKFPVNTMTTRLPTKAKKSISTAGVNHTPRKSPGRPKGRANNTTLVAAAIKEGLEQQLMQRCQHVMDAVLSQAESGCTISQKMVLDRIYPVIKAHDGATGPSSPMINISIGRAEDTLEVKRIQGETIKD